MTGPEPTRYCRLCGVEHPLSVFTQDADGYVRCKIRKSELMRRCRERESWHKRLLRLARSSAARTNREFALTEADLPHSDVCPLLGVRMVGKDYCASVDRIDSSKGYTPDNVQIISWRANKLKGDSSWEERQLMFFNETVMRGENLEELWRRYLDFHTDSPPDSM